MSSRLDRIEHWEEMARAAGYKVEVLAFLCKVTVRQLERHFQESFATTPQTWVSDLRMTDALHWLREGMSVKQVALLVAYQDESHFCRAFKRVTGHPPGKWPTGAPGASKMS